MRGPVSVVDHEGKEHLISEGSEIDMSRAIGLMLKSALLRARDQGILLQLSLAPTCALGVEDFDDPNLCCISGGRFSPCS